MEATNRLGSPCREKTVSTAPGELRGGNWGSIQMWRAENNFYHILQSPRKKSLSHTSTRRPFQPQTTAPLKSKTGLGL